MDGDVSDSKDRRCLVHGIHEPRQSGRWHWDKRRRGSRRCAYEIGVGVFNFFHEKLLAHGGTNANFSREIRGEVLQDMVFRLTPNPQDIVWPESALQISPTEAFFEAW